MEISKVGGFNTDSVESGYLRFSDLVEGMAYSKIAYVLNSNAGISKTNSGFAKFFLKDVDANVLSAYLFDVKDFVFSGLKISQFKGKAVRVNFVPQVFNGGYSLIIDGKTGIQEYTGEFDRKRFVGEIKYSTHTVMELGALVFGKEWELPPEYRAGIFVDIGHGRAGAFLKMAEIAADTLVAYNTVFNKDDFIVLLKVFFAVLETEYKVLTCKQNSELLEDVSIFSVFESLNKKYREDVHFNIILDAVKCVCGYGGGKSIYSHLVTGAVRQAKSGVDLVLVNNSLIVGAVAKTGGVDLLKY